jgi:hypothetical protein
MLDRDHRADSVGSVDRDGHGRQHRLAVHRHVLGMVDHVPHDARQVRPAAGGGDLEHVVSAVVGQREQRKMRRLDQRWTWTADDLD